MFMILFSFYLIGLSLILCSVLIRVFITRGYFDGCDGIPHIVVGGLCLIIYLMLQCIHKYLLLLYLSF